MFSYYYTRAALKAKEPEPKAKEKEEAKKPAAPAADEEEDDDSEEEDEKPKFGANKSKAGGKDDRRAKGKSKLSKALASQGSSV